MHKAEQDLTLPVRGHVAARSFRAASDKDMRALLIVGIVLVVIGIASLFVSVPHRETHGVQIGGAEVGVQTRSSERIPLPASIAIIIGGIVLAAVGGRARS